MKPPLFVRSLTEPERQHLETELHSTDAFRLRRAQVLLASARGLTPPRIADLLGGCEQNARNVIHAFNAVGLECLTRKSNRPKSKQPQLQGSHLERLQHLLHQSPRTFGKPTGLWTQALLAQVACAEGITKEVVSEETIRRALKRLGAHWKRAKHWITSPDPQYALKKSGASA
jgi:transposase